MDRCGIGPVVPSNDDGKGLADGDAGFASEGDIEQHAVPGDD